MEEIACNVDRILVLRGSHVYMDGTPRQVFRRPPTWRRWYGRAPGHQDRPGPAPHGLNIDTAVYTVDELEQACSP